MDQHCVRENSIEVDSLLLKYQVRSLKRFVLCHSMTAGFLKKQNAPPPTHQKNKQKKRNKQKKPGKKQNKKKS